MFTCSLYKRAHLWCFMFEIPASKWTKISQKNKVLNEAGEFQMEMLYGYLKGVILSNAI